LNITLGESNTIMPPDPPPWPPLCVGCAPVAPEPDALIVPEIAIDVTAIRSTAPPPWPTMKTGTASRPSPPGHPPCKVVGTIAALAFPPTGLPPSPPFDPRLPP
jgi:hypothetical protein